MSRESDLAQLIKRAELQGDTSVHLGWRLSHVTKARFWYGDGHVLRFPQGTGYQLHTTWSTPDP